MLTMRVIWYPYQFWMGEGLPAACAAISPPERGAFIIHSENCFLYEPRARPTGVLFVAP
jgi:hypothetical protein